MGRFWGFKIVKGSVGRVPDVFFVSLWVYCIWTLCVHFLRIQPNFWTFGLKNEAGHASWAYYDSATKSREEAGGRVPFLEQNKKTTSFKEMTQLKSFFWTPGHSTVQQQACTHVYVYIYLTYIHADMWAREVSFLFMGLILDLKNLFRGGLAPLFFPSWHSRANLTLR